MKAYWVIPAGLSGVGIGLALARKRDYFTTEEVLQAVRNLPQRGSVHIHAGVKPPHPPELTFECGWYKARFPLDEIGGVLIEHPAYGTYGETCAGSGRFPKL
jgi:hypothetical protein